MTILQVVNLLREVVGSASKLCEENVVKPSFLIDSSHAIECFGYVPALIDTTLLRHLEDLL